MQLYIVMRAPSVIAGRGFFKIIGAISFGGVEGLITARKTAAKLRM
jgi:hypothetical protein